MDNIRIQCLILFSTQILINGVTMSTIFHYLLLNQRLIVILIHNLPQNEN